MPLNRGTKPFVLKLIKINPILLPVIEKDIRKFFDANIIVPLCYNSRVESLVLVRKKNGKIRLCVDFRNLNKCSFKDNYSLPKKDHILQKVVGATRIYMMDGFSGYK